VGGVVDGHLDEIDAEVITVGPRERRPDQVSTVSAPQINNARRAAVEDPLPVEGLAGVAITRFGPPIAGEDATGDRDAELQFSHGSVRSWSYDHL